MDTMQTLPYNPDSVPDSQLSPKEGEMSPIQPLKGLSPSPSILKQTSSYTLNTAMDEGNEGDQEKVRRKKNQMMNTHVQIMGMKS